MITARGLNRSLLGRQLLLRREPLGVVEAVRRVVALQAQEAASPYLALWNRLAGFDPADLDAAFARREVVKATLMRITVHAVHAADYRAFREAVEPTLRAARLDGRYLASGLTARDADALLPELLEFVGEPKTSAELDEWLERRMGGPPHPGVRRAVRGYAPVLHVPTRPPWSFGPRPSYVAARPAPALHDPDASAAGLRVLVRRYLEGFGPASVGDVAQFGLVPRARVTAAVNALSDELERLDGPAGEALYDVPGGLRPAEDAAAPPRLMAMWDSVLLASYDRSRVIPPEYRALVVRSNGDVLPALLVDGYVAGVWRPLEGAIETTAFHRLTAGAWEGLASEARSLLDFLGGRQPEVYRRYGHWWQRLAPSAAEVRVLPGR